MPTLTLMKDQCQWIKKYGILVVALTANVIAINPTVWKKIEATRDYAIVLASQELLLQYASVFFLCTLCNKYSAFNKCLAYIAIDEAYLI